MSKAAPQAWERTVAQFAAFVDRAGRFRRAVAADAAGEGELLEELAQAVFVFALVGIDLGVGAFEIAVGRARRARRGRGRRGRSCRGRTCLISAVEVDLDEALAGVGAPVAEQAVLDVLGLERLAQQGIVVQVDHAGAEVIAGAPLGVEVVEFIGGEGLLGVGLLHRNLVLRNW